MKHTTGTWFFVDDGTIRSKAFGQSDMMADYQGCIVCDLKPAVGSEKWPPDRRHALPEAEANARLIAAAPTMKEALEEVDVGLHYYMREFGDIGGRLGDLRKIIYDALAKLNP